MFTWKQHQFGLSVTRNKDETNNWRPNVRTEASFQSFYKKVAKRNIENEMRLKKVW